MVSLPPAKEANIGDHEPNVLSAYNVILNFERNAKMDKDALHARILGYLILHAPSIHARHEMVRAIHSCSQDHDTLSELGQHFIDFYIRPFKKFKGCTPASSYHPSRPSFDKNKMGLLANIEEAPKDHKTAKYQALKRDDYNMEDILRTRAVHTHCTHIVPDPTYFDTVTPASSPEKRLHAATVLTVLKHFGYDVENLNGAKVHSLSNVMTMRTEMHDYFGRLEIWFEATEVKNCYRIKAANQYTDIDIYRIPEKITLTSTDPTKLPVPSPELLALHAACAKVAHLSGAAAYIDKLDREMEDMDVLAGDGRSDS